MSPKVFPVPGPASTRIISSFESMIGKTWVPLTPLYHGSVLFDTLGFEFFNYYPSFWIKTAFGIRRIYNCFSFSIKNITEMKNPFL